MVLGLEPKASGDQHWELRLLLVLQFLITQHQAWKSEMYTPVGAVLAAEGYITLTTAVTWLPS